MSVEHSDILVIGGGMAGASVAARLAGRAKVRLLEMERQPGYHTSGRSAALYEPNYGPPMMRALTRAGYDFFANPPEAFGAGPLISPRATLFIATQAERKLLADMCAALGADQFESLTAQEVRAMVPLLRDGYAVQGALNRSAYDIDVARLLQGFLRQAKATGGDVITGAEVTDLSRLDGLWHAQTRAGTFAAPIVVNAAGAWADQVGALAGAEPIGLIPKRRTALIVSVPKGLDISAWPMVIDATETFYTKPDAGRLLISPANEDPQWPGDAQPDELDIAICIDRITKAFDLEIGRVDSSWAGLRSFVADKEPIAGFSNAAEGFYWLAGQGGYGIQSAPGLSRFAASQILGDSLPADLAGVGVAPQALAPSRLAGAQRFAG